MGYIYKITNKINNKCYIGQTIRQPRLRFWEHTTKTKNIVILYTHIRCNSAIVEPY